ncbi:MAG: YbaN family protein [Vibrio sp.]
MFAGWLCVFFGVIGIVLPGIPTTPFILLASACFMRSSPKFHAWLTQHPYLGPILTNWHQHRAVSPKVKQHGYIVIGISGLFSFVMMPVWWGKLFVVCGFACIFYGFSRMRVIPSS